MSFFTNRKRIAWATGLVACLLTLLLILHFLRPDPQLARVFELRRQIADRELTPEQRREIGRRLGQEVRQLSTEQRRELAKDQSRGFREQMDRYFKLSRKEQLAYLDQQINRMEAMRRQQTPAGAAPANGNAPRSVSNEDRERRRKERLDLTTPEERAQRTEFFRQMSERRQQRGLPAFGGPPPRRAVAAGRPIEGAGSVAAYRWVG